MKRWIPRVALIILASGLAATALPGFKQRRAADACLDGGGVYDYATRACRSDVESLPAQSITWLQAPDGGSLMVAAFVALAILRLFVTLDRRARAARTSQ